MNQVSKKVDTKSGYVLLVTLMLIALGIGLISTIVQRALSYQRLMHVVVDREKARLLALGGIEIALSQVSFIQEDKPEQENNKEAQEKLTPYQRWLMQLMPVINTWQQVTFSKDKDKLDGTLSLYISSEQGKFDLAKLLEAPSDTSDTGNNKSEKNKAQEQVRAFVNELISKQASGIKLLDTAQQLQKQLGRSLEDATELVRDKTVQTAFQDKLFVQQDKQEKKDEKAGVYLTDIFTTRSRSGKLNPWFISKSLSTLMEFGYKHMDQELAKQLRPKMNWATDWDKIFKNIYGKPYQSLPQALRDILNTEFEATAFLVISSATVGTVTQKLAALLEKSDFLSQPYTTQKAIPGPGSSVFAVTKLYWL